jgi:hypothetical protein
MPPATPTPPPESPPLAGFVRALRLDGQMDLRLEPLDARRDGLAEELAELDRRARLEVAGDAPAYHPEAAAWAASLLYRLGQCAFCPDLGEATLRASVEPPCPVPAEPSSAWSVDLCLRHLPALWRWTRRQSHLDPLLTTLVQVGRDWPLSSVGIPGCDGAAVNAFIGDPTLLRLYADRIEAELDLSRLGHPRVLARIRSDLSIHPDLAPAFARPLQELPHG